MSLVWFKIPAYTDNPNAYYNIAQTNINAFKLIKEKTGLELTLTSDTHNDWSYYMANGISSDANYKVDFKFPDMETAQMCVIGLITDWFSDDSRMPICFVDVESHFFAIISPYWYTSNDTDKGYPHNHNVKSFVINMVYEDSNGSLKSGVDRKYNMNFYQYLNICTYNDMSDETIESLTIVPAFWMCQSDTYGSFIKNMYVNYTRKFKPGQKIIDNSGNVFIALGEYLLYYNGKKK